MFSLFLLKLILYSVAPIIPLLLFGYATLDFDKHVWVLKYPINPTPFSRGDYIPPSDLYQLLLPLVLCASLAADDINFGSVLLFHIVLFFKRIKDHMQELFHGLTRLYGASHTT